MKDENGFALFVVIITTILIGIVGYFGYKNINNFKKIESQETLATPTETPTVEVNLSNKTSNTNKPITVLTTPKPTVIPTTTPTKSPTPKPKYSCTVNTTFESDGANPKLYYGVTNLSGNYSMTGAQWDFDGNGTWDTDLSISNGTLYHKFENGTYNIKLRLQMSDNGFTNTCSKSITIPQASEYFTANFSGKVFKDTNCNNVWDTNEEFMSGVLITFFKKPEWQPNGTATSDSNGNYSLNVSMKNGDSLTMQPTLVAPDGYNIRFDAPPLTVNAFNKNANATVSLVPNESMSTHCQ